ncbi:hypothetical protein D9M69_476560 [compost metagenome]
MQQDDVQRIEQYNELIKSPEKVQEALIDSRLKAGNEAFTRGADGSFQTVNNMPFPMERGTVNVFDRQTRPFEHQTNGRGVIFENDDSLGRSKLVRGFEGIGSRLADLGRQALSASARFIGLEERKQTADEVMDGLRQSRAELNTASREQASTLSGELQVSRPSAAYIEGLNLQAVPLPQNARQGQQPDPHAQQRTDSFKSMGEKARSLNPSASIGEASQSGRKAFSGMVVDMDDHHILQKIGQTNEFVIHDRRDCDPNRTYQVGKSTVIVHDKGIDDLARNLVPKLEQDAGLSKAMRR